MTGCAALAAAIGVAVAAVVVMSTDGCERDVRLLPGLAGTAGGAGNAGVAGGAGAGNLDGGNAGAGNLDGGNAGGAGATGKDAAAGGSGAGGSFSCPGLGVPTLLPTGAGLVCASTLATRGHRFALCTCDVMTVLERIRTDAFDSTNSGQQDEVSAAVGTNAALQTTAELRAGGAVYVAGGAIASDHLQTGASLRVGGTLAMLSSNADVGGDAFVEGDVSGSVRISGALHVPTAALVGADVEATSVIRESVQVVSPCACDPTFVDASAALAVIVASNQDALAGLSQSALANVIAPAQIDLGCGRYLLDEIDAQAAVTLAVHGRVALAVTGDLVVRAGLTVALDDGAELDLVLGGRLATSGAGAVLGAPDAPARFRIWVAGTSTLTLDDGPTVGAVIHAPGSWVTTSAGLSLSGSLLARSLTPGGEADLHYDRAILSVGGECGEPAALPIP